MTRLITALIIGVVFDIGLAIAGMLNPSKVVGFLNIFGDWDPSLAFVMGGGLSGECQWPPLCDETQSANSMRHIFNANLNQI